MKMSKYWFVVPLATAAAFVAGVAAASKASAPQPPESSQVVFENERCRVILYHTNSGTHVCGLGEHSHPAHLYLMLTDSKVRTVAPDGKEEIADSKAGEVGWEPANTHRVENLLGNNVGCYVIEFKDRDWKPSTGLSP